jgi:hypothetical protein
VLGRQAAARQFVRFLVVGVANTAISFAVYRVLLLVGTPYAIAAPLAFIAGAGRSPQPIRRAHASCTSASRRSAPP